MKNRFHVKRVHQVSKRRNFMRNMALKRISLEVFCPDEARYKLSEQERFHGYMGVGDEDEKLAWTSYPRQGGFHAINGINRLGLHKLSKQGGFMWTRHWLG